MDLDTTTITNNAHNTCTQRNPHERIEDAIGANKTANNHSNNNQFHSDNLRPHKDISVVFGIKQ